MFSREADEIETDKAIISLNKGRYKKSKRNVSKLSLQGTQIGKMVQVLAKFKQAVKAGKPAMIIGPDYVVIDKNTYNEKFR
jgi:hypothetical protein